MIKFSRILKKRKGYVEQIEPFMRKSVAKVLTWQRCVGKSFLLYQLIEEILNKEPNANTIYINLEDFAFSSLQTAQGLHSYITSQNKEKERNYIFIDEIQGIPEFKKVIHSLLLNEDNNIYITGSNAKMLSGELATYLSGLYIEFNI